MRRIKQGLQHQQINMSCGGGERMHRRTQELGRFAFRSFQDTILLRTVKSSLDVLGRDSTYLHTQVEGVAVPMAVLGVSMESWRSARVGSKRIASRSLVYWTADSRCFGLVRGITKHDGKAFASIAALSPMGDGCFSGSRFEEWLLECSVVEGVVAYIEVAPDTFQILQPSR